MALLKYNPLASMQLTFLHDGSASLCPSVVHGHTITQCKPLKCEPVNMQLLEPVLAFWLQAACVRWCV